MGRGKVGVQGERREVEGIGTDCKGREGKRRRIMVRKKKRAQGEGKECKESELMHGEAEGTGGVQEGMYDCTKDYVFCHFCSNPKVFTHSLGVFCYHHTF